MNYSYKKWLEYIWPIFRWKECWQLTDTRSWRLGIAHTNIHPPSNYIRVVKRAFISSNHGGDYTLEVSDLESSLIPFYILIYSSCSVVCYLDQITTGASKARILFWEYQKDLYMYLWPNIFRITRRVWDLDAYLPVISPLKLWSNYTDKHCFPMFYLLIKFI